MTTNAGSELPARFGDYEILERIGTGGMAEVFRARIVGPEGFEKHVVLKRVLPHLAHDPALLELLSKEARVASVLQHANIVHVFDFGQVDGQYYMAMELVDGRDLLWLLRRCTRLGRPIPKELCLLLVAELCKALDYAHAATSADGRPLHLVHRDVSPSNVLISFEGDVKLMDFGVAIADIALASRAGGAPRVSLKAKIGYMSPEQVRGEAVDHRSDLFALGVILFETLTLRRLFVGRTREETLENIAEARVDARLERCGVEAPIARIIRQATARSPVHRFQRAAELQEACLDVLFEEGIRATHRALGAFVREIASLEEDAAPRATERVHVPTEPTAPPPVATTKPRSARSAAGKEAPAAPDTSDGVPATGSDSPPTWTVDLGRFTVPETLAELALDRATGRLVLEHGTSWKHVFLEKGAPVHVASNAKEERLGALLVERGMVREEDLRETAGGSGAGFLGDRLVRQGLLEPNALFRALEDQVKARLLALFTWREGSMAWHEGESPPKGVPRMRHDMLQLVTEGVRTHYDQETLWRWFEKKDQLEVHPVTRPGLTHNHLCFDSRELRFFAVLKEGQTVRQHLVAHARRSEDQHTLLRVLLLLHMAGLLELRR